MRLPLETWHCLRYKLTMLYDGQVRQLPGALHRVNSPNYTVWLLRRGTAELHCSREKRLCVEDGHWICIPPAFDRRQMFTRGTALLSVHFTATWPTGNGILQFDSPLIVPYPRWEKLEPPLRRLLGLHRRSSQPMPIQTFAARQNTLLSFIVTWYELLCGEGATVSGPQDLDPRIAQIMAVLDKADYSGAIPYRTLCNACNLSRVQLDRVFRASTGKSPRMYLEERILERVLQALIDPGVSIKELCLGLGFLSTPHFNQWFRRRMGLTPGEYRRRLQAREMGEAISAPCCPGCAEPHAPVRTRSPRLSKRVPRTP